MFEIKKINDNYYCDKFAIMTNDGYLYIYSDHDLNLYWNCSSDTDDSSHQYVITKENKKLYDIFSELYSSVVNKQVEYKDQVKPVVNNAIEWHSDDFAYDAASVVKIEKVDNNYVVTFVKSKIVYDDISPFSTFTVKFSLDNSRYGDYNENFYEMYKNLNSYYKKRHICAIGRTRKIKK